MHEMRSLDSNAKLSRRDFIQKSSANISAVAALAACLNGLSATAGDKADIVPKSNRYLLVDRRIVSEAKNIRFMAGSTVKATANPLFVENLPWEVRYDNLYPNIEYDHDKALYQCWYSPFIVDDTTSNTPPEKRIGVVYKPTHREVGICYAESKDGVNWEKPELGLTEFEGDRDNNIVLRGLHGAGIFRDTHDPNRARRFKAIGKTSEIEHSLSAAFSPDGLRWSEPVRCQGCTDQTKQLAFDTHNNAFWSQKLQKYVCITRLWRDGQRVVGRCESDDFLNWSLCEEVLCGDTLNQSYAMPVFEYADNYFGLLMLLNTEDDRVRCELTWSPDTVHWQRIDKGRSIIENSDTPKDYDWGCIYAARSPVILDDKIQIYYGGSNDTHGSWRKSCLALATAPACRIAGCEPEHDNQLAEIVLGPIVYQGDGIKISADVSGEITATVFTPDGITIAISEPITENVNDKLVAFHDSLESRVGKPVLIKFGLNKAKLYSCCI